MSSGLIKRYIIATNKITYCDDGTYEKTYLSEKGELSLFSNAIYFIKKEDAITHVGKFLPRTHSTRMYSIEECYVLSSQQASIRTYPTITNIKD